MTVEWKWHPLDISRAADTHLPPLLVSSTFKSDSYTIHLTDLTNIWSESLDHAAILRRSEEENTSIDPSDGDQLKILLDKLTLAIRSEKNTTLALTINPDAGRPAMTLKLTVPLPGGLAPLEWPVHLAAASQSVFTSLLVFPLLQAQHVRMQEITSLAEVLKEKDHVIQKLLDKLEAQGTELVQIFPQKAAPGGRKPTRKDAEEKVRSLRPFDMKVWRKDLDSIESRDTAQLIRNVFSGEGTLTIGIDNRISVPQGVDNWWDRIKGETIDLSNGASATNRPKTPSKPTFKTKESTQDSDAFQVQAEPAHHVSIAPKPIPPKLALNDSTDDEDLDAPSQGSKAPDSIPSSQPAASILSPKPAKKIGKVGGKKKIPKPPLPADGDSTADETSSPGRKQSPEKQATPPAPEAAPAKPKRGLGKIGGKKDLPQPPPVLEPSPPPPGQEVPKPKRGKLGQIGGKKKDATPPPPATPELEISPLPRKELGAIGNKNMTPVKVDTPGAAGDEHAPRGRSVEPEREKTPPPRETSEERADKKRRELKRELEEKAKAPVKKKRKF
jgi:hypothetical protein